MPKYNSYPQNFSDVHTENDSDNLKLVFFAVEFDMIRIQSENQTP